MPLQATLKRRTAESLLAARYSTPAGSPIGSPYRPCSPDLHSSSPWGSSTQLAHLATSTKPAAPQPVPVLPQVSRHRAPQPQQVNLDGVS